MVCLPVKVLLQLDVHLYLQRENVFRKSVTLINTSEIDDSGFDYLKE